MKDFAQVDELAKKASSQIDWLRQGRQELEVLRKDVLEFHESHADGNSAQCRVGGG